jgi:hypothetical protein
VSDGTSQATETVVITGDAAYKDYLDAVIAASQALKSDVATAAAVRDAAFNAAHDAELSALQPHEANFNSAAAAAYHIYLPAYTAAQDAYDTAVVAAADAESQEDAAALQEFLAVVGENWVWGES